MSEEKKGFPIYRMNEIHSMLCDLETNKYIDLPFTEVKAYLLDDRDVLFNRTNSYEWVGRTGIYYKHDNLERTFASYLVRFIPDPNIITPEYLTCYLNTRQGVRDLKRRARESINQTNINPEEVKEVEIPILSAELQNIVSYNLHLAHKQRTSAILLYQQAEDILLEELDLKNFKPNQQAINIKSNKDSFEITGRLDAEYYLPKYEEIINHIKSIHHKLLKELVIIKKSVEPGSNAYDTEGIPFIRVADYNKIGISEPTLKLKKDYYNANKERLDDLMLKKDTILLSKDGSIGVAYLMTEDSNSITSGAILHLTIQDDNILPEYLTLVLNSKVVQQQAERDSGGSIIDHWRISQVQDTIIPILNIEKQRSICNLVKQSFALKSQAENLLDIAKQAVEIAIECDEETAMEFITQNTNKMNFIN
ncbi:restriction endonuclease subunit S [Bartonella sp. HY406]|uniref:restriction endonuclease subunit S n=1 Tax=Bartonella sp. HY406 TaxID=2979331 RepID=UPI0021C80FF3|nr:restriction endonuclease subunit S [Bartonella sp. HY406]UXN03837.1 restriction endonuclease subunit S [Bartonella sp. HY406]